mgnify:CR=1 FL=1
MDLAYSLPALAALGYAVAAVCSKCALMAGFGVLRLAFLINLAFVPVFGLLLWVPSGGPNGIQWFAPVLTGAAFFVGQVFTFAAIRMGDVSVHRLASIWHRFSIDLALIWHRFGIDSAWT